MTPSAWTTRPSLDKRERLDLLDVALFVRAALLANVSAAGREFGLSAAVASSRIAQLEKLLGARLLHRTTRRISLTQDGEVFMTRAQALLDAALKSTWDVAPYLRSGELVSVLDTYPLAENVAIWAVYPSRAFVPPRTFAFIEFLAAHFGDPPYWDAEPQ